MNFLTPETVQDAILLLQNSEGSARVIAGGTDLLLEVDEGKRNPAALVDITGIKDLKKIVLDGNEMSIGAAVTLSEIAQSELIRKYFPSLAKASGSVGSLQIRNTATLAGNVITAQPAADGAMALAVLNPTFIIIDSDGERRRSIDELYAGFGKSSIDSSCEMMTEIRLPLLHENQAASFIRLELRKSVSLPMLNVSAMGEVSDGIFKQVRIAMGPVGVGPIRAVAAEKWLIGKAAVPENLKHAGTLALENAKPRSNPLRGSREYRVKTLPVLVSRALDAVLTQITDISEIEGEHCG